MRLLLVRHGRHDWIGRGIPGRMPNVPLNADGVKDAADLAERLAPVRIDAIYSSPQLRARETAEPLASARNLPVQIAPDFDEIEFGEWTGRTFADLEASDAQRWRMWCERRSEAVVPGGESLPMVRERVMSGVGRLFALHANDTVLVTCHGDVIKAVVATHLKMSLDDLETFDVDCCSVTILDLGPGWAKVKQVSGTHA